MLFEASSRQLITVLRGMPLLDGRGVCAGAVLWEASDFTRNGREGGRGSESERASERERDGSREILTYSDFSVLVSLLSMARYFVDASYPLPYPPRSPPPLPPPLPSSSSSSSYSSSLCSFILLGVIQDGAF